MSETKYKSAEIKTAKDFTESAINAIEQYWTFDNNQRHTHSWHDKQKCLDNLRRLLPLYFDVHHAQFKPSDEEILSSLPDGLIDGSNCDDNYKKGWIDAMKNLRDKIFNLKNDSHR